MMWKLCSLELEYEKIERKENILPVPDNVLNTGEVTSKLLTWRARTFVPPNLALNLPNVKLLSQSKACYFREGKNESKGLKYSHY